MRWRLKPRLNLLGFSLIGLLLKSLSLLVGDTVEINKQEKVRTQKGTAKDGRGFSTGTATHVGQVRPVGICKVGVGTEVNNKEVNDELGNLESG